MLDGSEPRCVVNIGWRCVFTIQISREIFAHVWRLHTWSHAEADVWLAKISRFSGPKVWKIIIARPCRVEILVDSIHLLELLFLLFSLGFLFFISHIV